MSDNNNNGYEKFCYLCRRPESAAGEMIQLPQNICVCRDCMQKTFDTMNNFGFMGDMASLFPGMGFAPGAQGQPSAAEPVEGQVVEGQPDEGQVVEGQPAEGKEPEDQQNKPKGPAVSFINLGEFPGFGGFMPGFMGGPQVKPKKKEKKDGPLPAIDINNIPAPHKIKAELDAYVVGQDHAKKVMSVAVYNHYKRVTTGTMDEIEIEKSNMLMIGPTGSGKTYLVKTLARLLDVPLAITDATSLTEAGYIGDDIESVVSKLLAAADNDVERAEKGIIFIDEIDKLAKKRNAHQRDVSGESVQQGMLKLLEGAEVEVPVGASSKNAMVPMTTIDTKNILFICGGAFPELENVIKERLNKSSSMGFMADLKDKYDDDENILAKATAEDLRKFGMIPEFIGRLPILFALDALSEEMLVRILREPKNALIKQYQKLLELDEVKLLFTDDALTAIAKKAKERELGARALRAIIEEFMLDIMYEIPKDDNIGQVIITEDYINGSGGPEISMRG